MVFVTTRMYFQVHFEKNMVMSFCFLWMYFESSKIDDEIVVNVIALGFDEYDSFAM